MRGRSRLASCPTTAGSDPVKSPSRTWPPRVPWISTKFGGPRSMRSTTWSRSAWGVLWERTNGSRTPVSKLWDWTASIAWT